MHEPVAIRCCVKQRQQLPEDTTVIYISVTNEPSSQFARFDRLIGWLCSQQWRPPANHYTSLSLRFALIAFDAVSAEVMFSGHVCLITNRVTEKVIGGFSWNLRTNIMLQELLNFWATVCKTVRLMLSDRCHVCSVCLSVCPVCLSVCDVGVLWPNGCMDQDETWHSGSSCWSNLEHISDFYDSSVVDWCENWKWIWENQLQHSAPSTKVLRRP